MNTPSLEAVNLSRSYLLKKGTAGTGANGILRAVDNVSISVMGGETLGIAGESGCGKSTLAKMMAGLLKQNSGTVRYMGSDILQLPHDQKGEFRRSVQMIFQDPFSSLNPRMRIGDAIAEPLQIHKLCSRDRIQSEVIKLMEQTGLSEELYNRFPHEFSGGQRQRIVIARALAPAPSILVADEPVSSLDISIQAQIINLLLELRQAHGLTMIIISHDMGVLRQICHRIAVMYLGRIVETATTESLFEKCMHPYTEALLTATPGIKKRGISRKPLIFGDTTTGGTAPSGCSFHPRCPHARDLCRTEAPELLQYAEGHFAACHFSRELYGN